MVSLHESAYQQKMNAVSLKTALKGCIIKNLTKCLAWTFLAKTIQNFFENAYIFSMSIVNKMSGEWFVKAQ